MDSLSKGEANTAEATHQLTWAERLEKRLGAMAAQVVMVLSRFFVGGSVVQSWPSELEVAIEPDKTVVFGSWNPWLFGRHLSANCLWNMSHSMSVTDNYSTTHFGGVENFDPYTVFRNRSWYFSEAHGPAACTPLQKWTVSWSSEMTLATLKEFCTQTYAFWPSLPACRRLFFFIITIFFLCCFVLEGFRGTVRPSWNRCDWTSSGARGGWIRGARLLGHNGPITASNTQEASQWPRAQEFVGEKFFEHFPTSPFDQFDQSSQLAWQWKVGVPNSTGCLIFTTAIHQNEAACAALKHCWLLCTMVDPGDVDVYTVKTFVVKWIDGQCSWLVLGAFDGMGIATGKNARKLPTNLKPLKATDSWTLWVWHEFWPRSFSPGLYRV